jgi:hypothetical protein
MEHQPFLSLAAAFAAAAPSLLPKLGFYLVHLLLWAAAHADELRGFSLLVGVAVKVGGLALVLAKLYLTWPRLLRRFGWA